MKYFYQSMLAALMLIVSFAPCSAQTTQNMTTPAGTRVEIETSKGKVTVLLYDDTPNHRDNFLHLVNEHYYDSVLFHRVIKDFMVQTGDGSSRNAAPGAMLGSGDLDYTVPAEFVYPKHFHKRGALAAARTGDQVNPERRSSASQFYIVTGRVYSQADIAGMEQSFTNRRCQAHFGRLVQENMDKIQQMQAQADTTGLEQLRNNLIQIVENDPANVVKFTPEQVEAYTTIGGTPHLDGEYTVYGEVLEGMDVIDAIQNVSTDSHDRPLDDIRILQVRVVGK